MLPIWSYRSSSWSRSSFTGHHRRATWEEARRWRPGTVQPDGEELNATRHGRFYPYRSRIRCRDCQRCMAGNTYNIASQIT